MGLAEVLFAPLVPQHGLPHSTEQADWILESQAASGDSLDGRCDACRGACKKHILQAAPEEESPRSHSREVLQLDATAGQGEPVLT